MLDEMPVSALSLNELSRRVGLAKSNVLRYFESREAVLLELLAHAATEFLAEVGEALQADVDPSTPAITRARDVAATLSASFAARPKLCELLSAQAGVLERNVSTEVVLKYKLGARDSLTGFAALLRQVLPEIQRDRSVQGAQMIIILVGALWTHSHPTPPVLAAYETDPSLAFMHQSFASALNGVIVTFLLGLTAQGSDSS